MTTVSAASNDRVKWPANSPKVLSKTVEAGKQWAYLSVFPEARSTSQDGSHEGPMLLRQDTSHSCQLLLG